MYKIVYPENGEAVVPIQFVFAKDAKDYWRTHHGGLWVEINPQNPADSAAFMQCVTGEIVVIRETDG